MNIYLKKQRWKVYLLFFAILIAIGSFWFTNNLARELAREERKKVELWAKGIKEVANVENLDKEYSNIAIEVIENNKTVPVILADENNNIISSRNISKKKHNQEKYLQKLIREMKKEHEPISFTLSGGQKRYIYYKDSTILTQLFYFPLIQLGVVGLFLFIAYYAFSTSRKSEQNQVWVGMAKETAHQLGTPTSSLLATQELLKLKLNDETLIKEIEKDVGRLQKITDRFSKIGSNPVIKKQNIIPVLYNAIDYIQSRTSKKVTFDIQWPRNNKLEVPFNEVLFEWVIENLFKNALDSINGQGSITVNLTNKQNSLVIDCTDDGKGIPKSKQKIIFHPGFTSKKRGWGLGLSLAKRIVEDYHNGKIFVHHSEPKKGTTMRIVLKKD